MLPNSDHKTLSTTIKNPFDNEPPPIQKSTAKEIATLQARLNKQLGPEFISTRSGPGGGKVAYIAAEKVINLANEVFGFNGWSSSIQNVQIDYVDESSSTGKISLGLSIIVRVTLKDGTYHEDIGYGSIENARGKSAAFEKAKKEAATDAMKRALRTFGNLLGNCLYDKDHLGKIGKLKVTPAKWDPEKLHRHPDYRPKTENVSDSPAYKHQALTRTRTSGSTASAEFEDDFGGSLFDGVEISETHGDEVTMNSVAEGDSLVEAPKVEKQPPTSMPPPPRQQVQRMQSMPALQQGQNQQPSDPYAEKKQQARMAAMAHRAALQSGAQQQSAPQQTSTNANGHGSGQPKTSNSSNPDNGNPINRQTDGADRQNRQTTPDQQPQLGSSHNENLPVTFVSSRAAEMLQQTIDSPQTLPAFNPHAESPSLRRTSGVNHSRSAPISRQAINNPPTSGLVNAQSVPQGNAAMPLQPANQVLPNPAARSNFIDPRADVNRRIGMPGAGQSPLANRGAYKPPGPAHGIKRPPLADVSNVTEGGGIAVDGTEAKKARVAGA